MVEAHQTKMTLIRRFWIYLYSIIINHSHSFLFMIVRMWIAGKHSSFSFARVPLWNWRFHWSHDFSTLLRLFWGIKGNFLLTDFIDKRSNIDVYKKITHILKKLNSHIVLIKIWTLIFTINFVTSKLIELRSWELFFFYFLGSLAIVTLWIWHVSHSKIACNIEFKKLQTKFTLI